jgi:hypothetical protein
MRLLGPTAALVSVAGVLAVLSSQGPASSDGPPLVLAGLGESEKPAKDAPVPRSPHFWDPVRGTLMLHAGRNEVVAGQLLLTARRGDVKGVAVTIGDLQGPATIPAETAIEPALELYQYVANGNWHGEGARQVLPDRRFYPDVLVPFRDPYDPAHPPVGNPFDITVANGRNQAVWIDVVVPKDAVPGTYRAPISVTAEGRACGDAILELTVHPFTLPDETHVDAYGEVYGRAYAFHGASFAAGAERWWEVARRYHQMAHRHRLVIAERAGAGPGLGDEAVYARTYGSLFDGSAFSQEAGYRGPGEGTGVPFWPAPFVQKYDLQVPDLTADQLSEYTAAARTFWERCRRNGWDAKRFFAYVVDEADVDPRTVEIYRQLQAALDAGAGPGRIDLIWTSHASPATFAEDPRTDLRGVVRWWAPNAAACDPLFLRPRVEAGETVWFYHHGRPCVGVQAVNASGIEMRTWGAISWRYGMSGSFYWAVDLGDENDPLRKPIWKAEESRWGNGVLFYPGARLPDVGLRAIDGPLSSLRMKAYRRGLQDYEYAWLLARSGRRDVADAAFRRLVPVALREGLESVGAAGGAPWATDPSAWYAARQELAEALARSRP